MTIPAPRLCPSSGRSVARLLTSMPAGGAVRCPTCGQLTPITARGRLRRHLLTLTRP